MTRFTAKDTRATVELDGSVLDFRLALAPCHHGEALVVRLLDPKRLERSVEELGLSGRTLEQIEQWLEHMTGIRKLSGLIPLDYPLRRNGLRKSPRLLHRLKTA